MSWEKAIDDGAAQYLRGEFKESEQTFASAVESLKGNDTKRSEYAEALEWLGRSQIWLAKYDAADESFTRSREIKSEIYGAESKEVALVDLYRADLAIAKQEFEEAHGLATKAFETIEKTVGANDLAIAEAASRVGLSGSYLANKVDESESYLNKSLGIRRSKLGEEDRLVGETLDELSQCHALAENFTMAGALGRKALAIKEKALGPDHPEVGVTLYHLSTQYVRTLMFEKAEPIARRGVDILSKLPADNEYKIRMMERLATICNAKGNLDEAERLHTRALSSAEKLWGADNPNIVSNLVGLASTNLNQNDFSNAEKHFKRSLRVMERQAKFEAGQEYSLLQNLSCCYIFQLKLGDMLQLVPATFRSRNVANYSGMLDLIRKTVEFAIKQIDGYKKDRGDYS
ncbi:tetratricopeptide repeat protein [Candidatus Obscuribacterales bacterium]|nr:tetratricopeptide repeat protein [Candidatus Obscuribacterales bacterium]